MPTSPVPDDLEPGMVLRHIETKELLLVGDVNAEGGQCDCCTDLRHDSERAKFELLDGRVDMKEFEK